MTYRICTNRYLREPSRKSEPRKKALIARFRIYIQRFLRRTISEEVEDLRSFYDLVGPLEYEKNIAISARTFRPFNYNESKKCAGRSFKRWTSVDYCCPMEYCSSIPSAWRVIEESPSTLPPNRTGVAVPSPEGV